MYCIIGIAKRVGQKARLPLVALVPILLVQGCSSMNNTDKGVLAGGGLGAGAGALIGSATGHTGLGALAGGTIGAISGGLIGSSVDESEKKADARAVALANSRPQPAPLGMTDVVQMSYQHISDDIIITQIRNTGSVYQLSGRDIGYLKEQGVSDPVIREMQMTVSRPVQRVYTATPVYVVPEPPPVRVGVGVGYVGGHCYR